MDHKKYIKKALLFSAAILFYTNTSAQNSDSNVDFQLGKGLNIELNNGAYTFNVGGFIQPNFMYSKSQDADSQTSFGIKRSYLSVSGNAAKEKVSFLLQMDFTDGNPIMDAWIAYTPVKNLKISAGQKQTFTNNLEMTFLESNLSMTDRSILSSSLSNSGREFGLFLESDFSLGSFKIAPKIAATSGDGRNSFGSSSTDPDNGGFKYGGRLDIYPFGSFTNNNDLIEADLVHEDTPKVKLGVAGSYNQGASDSKGDGHGNFILYGSDGKQKLPDYRKLYVDVLAKYKGLSVIGEYANATGASLSGIYTDTGAVNGLVHQQIADYLALGNIYNFQIGYTLKSGYALDVRYAQVSPEIDTTTSILKETRAYNASLTKYFIDNRLKIQGGVSYLDYPNKELKNNVQAELIFQIVF